MLEPLIKHAPGAWGTLIYPACPLCNWRGRKRDPNGSRYSKTGEVRLVVLAAGLRHLEIQHGQAPGGSSDV